MVTPFLALLVAYLIGAIPVGFVVARVAGLGDIRRHGSGNIGATNVLRTLGRGPAVITLLGDVAKGYLAVMAGAALAGGGSSVAGACALAAMVGNCWSVFLGFRGGKGMATGLGAFLRAVPWATVPAIIVFIGVTAVFRWVSLASLMAAVCTPLGVLLLGYPPATALACAGAAAIVVIRHRANITRLLEGTEPRLGQRAEPR